MSNLATLKQDPQNGKWIAEYQGTVLTKSNSKPYVIEAITTGRCNKAKKMNVTGFLNAETMTADSDAATQQVERTPIDKRFEFLENFTNMICERSINSLIVTGEGGLGKTYTIQQCLEKNNLEDTRDFAEEVKEALRDMYDDDPEGVEMPGDYIIIKGYSTSKALYRTLWENRNKIVIFDDCDKVLQDQVAVNVLKGALDSYDKRLICWNSELKKDDNLPRSFEFNGQVIFISNMPQHALDQALKSRSLRVDLSMTPSEKIERMATILPHLTVNVNVTDKDRKEALAFIDENKDVATDLNIRTLMNVLTIRAEQGKDWKDMALYTITA